MIQWAMSSGHIPILQNMSETDTGQLVGIDIRQVTAQVASKLKPRKVLFINTHGGFVDENGEVKYSLLVIWHM